MKVKSTRAYQKSFKVERKMQVKKIQKLQDQEKEETHKRRPKVSI